MKRPLKPASANTLRLIALVASADRPMKLAELIGALGLAVTTVRRHLVAARKTRDVALVGGGRYAAWATPAVADATRAAIYEGKCARRRARRAASRAPPVDPNEMVQARRSTWEPVTVAPGPNSVFALAGTLA